MIILVGFGRACTPVRCAHPSFLAYCEAKQGAARPPPPVAALLLLIRPPKIYKIYRAWVAGVKGFFLSTLPPSPESIQSARPSIQSSKLGPLTPKRVLFPPPLDPRGETHSLSEGVGGINSDDGTYTLVLYVYMYYSTYNSNPSTTGL
jgi:hypothetical protein